MAQPGDSITYRRLRVFATAAILALLVTSNLILLDIAGDPEPRQAVAPRDDAPPPLPPTRGEGSSRSLARQLERSQAELAAPLARTVEELQALRVTASAVQPLPELLGRVADSTGSLAGIQPQLGRLAGVADELARIRRLAATVRRDAGGIPALDTRFAAIQRSLARIDRRMAAVLERFDALGPSVEKLLPALAAMAEDVERIRQCTEQPAACGVE